MAWESGYASYPGLADVRRFDYTQTPGTRPDVCTIMMGAHLVPTSIAAGTLSFHFGATVISLPGSTIDFGTLRKSYKGNMVGIRILDRRWCWQAGGEINGHWNERWPNGSLRADREKTPQQLAAMLLNQMGENNYDVSQLPNLTRPEVMWECSHPATELERLVRSLGCVVTLGYGNDPVTIWPLGVGPQLPNSTDIQTLSFGYDPQELPSYLKVCANRTKYQSKLLLEAVGMETAANDNKILLIDDLSYKPADGWGDPSDGFQNIDDPEAQRLARATVFKWFRVKAQADGSKAVPGYIGNVEVDDMLPLRTDLVKHWENDDDQLFRSGAYLEGVFYRYWERPEPTINAGTEDDHARYEGGFKILTDQGIVVTSNPVVKMEAEVAEEPDLFLTTSYHVRDADHHAYDRAFKQVALSPTPCTGPRVYVEDAVQRMVYAEYEGTGITDTFDNDGTVIDQLDEIISAKLASFTARTMYNVTYHGLKLLRCNGGVRQVRYYGNLQGARTDAGWNSEPNSAVFTAREKYGILERKLAGREARTALSGIQRNRRRGTV